MNLALTVINICLPVFILALVGFVWVRLGFEYRLQFVTRLAMSLAVPCLVFTALARTEVDPAALSLLTLATFASYSVIALFLFIFLKIMRLNLRTYLAPLVFGNTGNVGLPLALFAFGPEGLSLGVIVLAVTSIASFTLGVWVVSGGGSLIALVREPLVGATLAGAVFLWQGWPVPDPIFNALDLIGQMAIPLVLITLGVAIARLTPHDVGRAVWLAAFKVCVCASCGWGVAVAFDLPPMAAAVLTLQMGTPVAVTSYLLAEKYNADAQAVAGLVVVSTLMAVVSLPALLAVLL